MVDSRLDRTLLPASKFGQRSAATSPWESRLPSAASSPNKAALSEPSPCGTVPDRDRVTERSTRTLSPFLVNWVNFHCSDLTPQLIPRLTSETTADELAEAFKNGVALCKLVECILPDLAKKDKPYSGGGLYPKALMKNPSMTNLERALPVAWRRGVYAKNMCSAEDFWNCRVPRVLRCLSELFHSLEMREVLKNIKETMRGMNAILATIGRPLSYQTLDDPLGPGSHFISDFADGTRIMILLIYYGTAGSEEIGMMLGSPQELRLIEENGAVLEQALRKAKFPVLLSPVEWSKPLDIESLIFQIDLIWRGHRFWESEDWNGLMYSMPAKKGKALEGLNFKFDEPVQLMEVSRGSRLRHLLDDEKKVPVRRALSPAKEAKDMESRPRFLWKQRPTGLERPLWKDGNDPLDLEALREFKSDLFGNFTNLQAAFESFDTQKTGSLTLSEFQWGCRAIAHEGNSKRVFANLDINSVGRITVAAFNELNSLPGSGMGDSYRGLGDETSRQTWAMRDFASKVNFFYGTLADGFLASDSTGSGWMSHADLELLVEHVGLSSSDDWAKVIIRTLDEDSSGRITQSEFCHLEDLIAEGGENASILKQQPMLWEEGGDPADLLLLREFADLLHDRFCNPQEAFDAFAASGTGRLNISGFQQCATAIGFTGDAKKLFVIMDVAQAGSISNEEFWSLDRLPQPAPAVPETAKVLARVTTITQVSRRSEQIEVILNGAQPNNEWPSPSALEAMDAEVRLAGSSEELEWLSREDGRRNQELEQNGQADVADKSRDAGLEAIKAVQEESGVQASLGHPAKLSQIQGTTSLDVRILMPDGSQQRMWLQTAVVDRTGKGSAAADDAVFVVELRQQQCRGRASTLVAHIDLSRITAITQMGPGDFAEPSADISFIISFERRGLIGTGPKPSKGAHLSPSEVRNNRLSPNGTAEATGETLQEFKCGRFFQSDDDGATWSLHVVVGPSTWQRRLGICFFDELRILMHFMAENITSAATSLGAAAGAALGAAGRRRSF